MDPRDAEIEITRVGKGVRFNLADLKERTMRMETLAQEERRAAIRTQVYGALKPFKSYDVVNDWLAAFMYPAICARKKFLVLSGPSTVGKSYFARSLVPTAALCEVNSANATHANLTLFKEGTTRLILWDEASADFIAANRKLMQHAPVEIDTGMTASGLFTKYYFLADACSVVCTNDWDQSVRDCKKLDARNWCTDNAVVLRVSEPMWISASP
jgi:hypothetical protein